MLDQPDTPISGIDLPQGVLVATIGSWGTPIVTIAVFFCASISVIANYTYAENNLVFLEHNHPADCWFSAA